MYSFKTYRKIKSISKTKNSDIVEKIYNYTHFYSMTEKKMTVLRWCQQRTSLRIRPTCICGYCSEM